jgi:predicted nucleic acid-binding protein
MLLDTSAWIEFLTGTDRGKRVEEVLNSEKCYTAMTTIAEIANFSAKAGEELSSTLYKVERLTEIIDLDARTAIIAGQINNERKKIIRKWGMVDSFVLATSITHNLKILAKDSDFQDLDNAEIL